MVDGALVPELVQRDTRWGWLATVRGQDDRAVAEVMHFNQPGQFHSHDRWEYVICVSGSGAVVVEALYGGGTRRYDARFEPVPIPPGRQHRMEPEPEGMTCVLWYREFPIGGV